MAQFLAAFFQIILQSLYMLLLVSPSIEWINLAAGVLGSWFTWGMLLFVAINTLSVVFSVIYLRVKR